MSQISLSAKELQRLSKALSGALGEKVEVVSLEEVPGGANNANHKKATLKDGRVFGLKAAERVQKGTSREYLLAQTAKTLGIPGSGTSGIFKMPDNLLLAGKQVAALEWLPGAKGIDKLPDVSEKRKSLDTAKQLGQWIWLSLHFQVGDRKMANWAWSEEEGKIIMIDCEAWKSGTVTPSILNARVKEALGGSLSEEQAAALLDGMKTAKESLAASKGELSSMFEEYGESLESDYDDYSDDDVIKAASEITGIAKESLTCKPDSDNSPK